MRAIITFIFCIQAFAGFGQPDPFYRSLSVLNGGLPSNIIYFIQQGSNGEILIGHERGITRYNGLTCSDYKIQSGPTSMGNILELNKGTYVARNFFNDIYTLTPDLNTRKIDSLSYETLGFSSFFRAENKVYQVVRDSVFLFWDGTQIVHDLIYTNLDPGQLIVKVVIIGDIMYLCSEKLFIELDLRLKKAIHTHTSADFKVLYPFQHGNEIHFLHKEKSEIFKLQNGKLVSVKKLEKYDPEAKITWLLQLKDGTILIASFNGIHHYTSDYRLIGHYFRHTPISTLMEDMEGNLWVGTLQDGIRILPDLRHKVFHTGSLPGKEEKISRFLILNDSTLLIGTYNGKVYFIGADGEIRQEVDFHQKSEIESLAYNPKEETFHAYCTELRYFRKDGRVFRKEKVSPVKDMAFRDGVQYEGTSCGLRIKKGNARVSLFPELWIKKVVPLGNYLYLESSSGILRLRLSNYQLEPIVSHAHERKILENARGMQTLNQKIYFSSGTSIYSLHQGTLRKVLEVGTGEISTFTVNNQYIWTSDGTTIARYSLATGALISEFRGLTRGSINQLAWWHGKLLAIGPESFQLIPINYSVRSTLPRLTLKHQSGTYTRQDRKWVSPFESNSLVMQFELLPNIRSGGTNTLLYRIHPIMDDWKEVGGNENYTISEERLPPGRYTLEVRGATVDGRQTDSLRFPLEILPQFYNTWWFRGLVVLCAAGLLFLIYRYRLRKIERKTREKLERVTMQSNMIEAELKALRSQMNPHFIFNSLSVIQSKILSNDSKEAYKNLSAFSKLLRLALQFTRKEWISLADEISFIDNYILLEKERFGNDIHTEIIQHFTGDPATVLFPSLLTQPFVENAFRHGLKHQTGRKELILEVRGTADQLTLTIRDNGIGIEASQKINAQNPDYHESFATNAIQERLKITNGYGKSSVKITTTSLNPGTLVTITVNHTPV